MCMFFVYVFSVPLPSTVNRNISTRVGWLIFLVIVSTPHLRTQVLMQARIVAAHAVAVAPATAAAVMMVRILVATAATDAQATVAGHRVRATRARRHHWRGRAAGAAHRVRRSSGCLFGRIQIGLLLCLADVLLVANALVAEPVGHLRDLHTTAHTHDARTHAPRRNIEMSTIITHTHTHTQSSHTDLQNW